LYHLDTSVNCEFACIAAAPYLGNDNTHKHNRDVGCNSKVACGTPDSSSSKCHTWHGYSSGEYMGNLKTMKNLFGYIMSAWSFHKQAQDVFFPMNQLWNVPAVNAWNVQVTLGISTLLTYVPASLGAAHQAGALTLFTIVLGLMHSLRRPLSTSLATAQLSQQQKSLLKAWK
jgi:hypothetical protein